MCLLVTSWSYKHYNSIITNIKTWHGAVYLWNKAWVCISCITEGGYFVSDSSSVIGRWSKCMVNDVVKIPTPIINYQSRLFWKHQRKKILILIDQLSEIKIMKWRNEFEQFESATIWWQTNGWLTNALQWSIRFIEY